MEENSQSLNKKTPEQIEVERDLLVKLSRFMSDNDRKVVISNGVVALSKFMKEEEAKKLIDKVIQKIREMPRPPFIGTRKY